MIQLDFRFYYARPPNTVTTVAEDFWLHPGLALSEDFSFTSYEYLVASTPSNAAILVLILVRLDILRSFLFLFLSPQTCP